MTQPYHEQDKGIWKEFVRNVSVFRLLPPYVMNGMFLSKVCDEHPYLNQFEDHWPLAIYLCKFLTAYLQRAEARKQNDEALHKRNNPKPPPRIVINIEDIPRPSIAQETLLVDVNSRKV